MRIWQVPRKQYDYAQILQKKWKKEERPSRNRNVNKDFKYSNEIRLENGKSPIYQMTMKLISGRTSTAWYKERKGTMKEFNYRRTYFGLKETEDNKINLGLPIIRIICWAMCQPAIPKFENKEKKHCQESKCQRTLDRFQGKWRPK